MSRLSRWSMLAAAAAALASGAALLSRRTPEAPRRPADRVIFLGFDGVDPDLVEILAAQGKLPALRRLMEAGSYGRLKSASPTKSGILWTSVATGKTMLKHGIIDWTYVNKTGLQVPYEDRARKVKTYWEILSERGVRTGTLNWWMSYPPRPIANGYIVSNAFRHRPEPETVHPRQLFARLDPLRLDGTQALVEMQRLGIPLWKKEDATLPLHAAAEVLDAYRLYASQDLTVDRVSDRLFESQPVEVFSTYFRLVDVTSHFAVHFTDRRIYDETVRLEDEGRLTPEALARMDAEFARVLAPVYALMDRIVAKYLARMDARTVLLLASDHGFDFFRGNYAHAHGPMEPPDGVVFVAGPGVRRGFRIPEAKLYDIAPTILYAMGQPAAADMDGSVLGAAFEERQLARHPVRTVATYELSEGAGVAAAAREHPQMDKEVLDDLKTLGYIQGGREPTPTPGEPMERERR